MRKLITVALAATLLAAAPGGAVAAQDPFAQVLSHVKLQKDGTATVRARYRCESATHLWVSAKQTADGSVDPALEAEGSSGAAAAWMDTNSAPRARSQLPPMPSMRCATTPGSCPARCLSQ